jgi:putative transposase
MPRIPRGQLSGYAHHVINRGNGGAVVFHEPGDYRGFLELLAVAKTKVPVKVLGFCLMPNHFHIVLAPAIDQALSPFMQWWLTSHVRRHHRHYGTSGHVWQGRFKSFPIQQDEHLLMVLRYVLRNPVRAGFVERANQWPWSSLAYAQLTDPWPVEVPSNWAHWLEEPLSPQELARVRECVNRQAPFGSAGWQGELAFAAGLESTLRPKGRPRKYPKK